MGSSVGTTDSNVQFTTFAVNGETFGIEVREVQEVTGSPSVVPVPLAPNFVRGLINLRGQIATALGLRELFGQTSAADLPQMSVVCKIEGNLVSLIVDSIGDVIEVERSQFERPPDTMPRDFRKYIRGVYKLDNGLMSVVDLEMLAKELSPAVETA